jgi:quinol monooxygenase YgiN
MISVMFGWVTKEGCRQAFIDDWQAGSDVIQTYPGSIRTRLFESIDEPDAFIAVADWESLEAREAAMKAIEMRPDGQMILRGYEKLVKSTTVIARLRFIGEAFSVVKQ